MKNKTFLHPKMYIYTTRSHARSSWPWAAPTGHAPVTPTAKPLPQPLGHVQGLTHTKNYRGDSVVPRNCCEEYGLGGRPGHEDAVSLQKLQLVHEFKAEVRRIYQGTSYEFECAYGMPHTPYNLTVIIAKLRGQSLVRVTRLMEQPEQVTEVVTDGLGSTNKADVLTPTTRAHRGKRKPKHARGLRQCRERRTNRTPSSDMQASREHEDAGLRAKERSEQRNARRTR